MEKRHAQKKLIINHFVELFIAKKFGTPHKIDKVKNLNQQSEVQFLMVYKPLYTYLDAFHSFLRLEKDPDI